MFRRYLLLQGIVLLWGFTAILGTEIGSNNLNMLLYRTGVSVVVLLPILLLRKMSYPSKKNLGQMVLSGLTLGVHWIFFYGAARVSNVSVSVIGLATAPLFVVLAEFFFHRGKKALLLSETLLAIFSVVGMYIIFSESQFVYWTGLSISIVAGFLSGLYTMQSASLTKKENTFSIVTVQMMTVAILLVMLIVLFQCSGRYPDIKFETMNGKQWSFILVFAILCTVVPFLGSTFLLKKLSAFAVNLSVNAEPVYAILLAQFLFPASETMSSRFYIGTSIIILSLVMYPLAQKYFDSQEINWRQIKKLPSNSINATHKYLTARLQNNKKESRK